MNGNTIARRLGRNYRVQWLVGSLVRDSSLQLLRPGWSGRKYLNVGCGEHPHEDFLNLDYWWSPGIDLCWDIRRRLPFPDSSLRGIFTEHCLEHVSYEECRQALQEFRRILDPDGTLRVVVPDAELYLDLYQRSKLGEPARFPYSEGNGGWTAMMHVNRIFRHFGHRFAYDFESLQKMLEGMGWRDVRRAAFREGRDPRLLIDSERRAVESLYVEARPPCSPTGC